jgi:hypothetical protein
MTSGGSNTSIWPSKPSSRDVTKRSGAPARRSPTISWLDAFHVVEMSFQRVEAAAPGGPVGRQPLVDLAERLGPDPVQAPLRVGAHLDQARLAQHPQVLGNAGLADAQRGHQVADGLLPLAQQVQDPPPMRLGQYLEHAANITTSLYNCQVMYMGRRLWNPGFSAF